MAVVFLSEFFAEGGDIVYICYLSVMLYHV